MNAVRARLPNRRHHEAFEFVHEAQIYRVGIGRYEDGRLAEVFLNCGKSGTAVQTHAHDSAVLVSLLLQYGVPLDAIRHSLTRLPNNVAAGPIGALLDLLAAEEPRAAATACFMTIDEARAEQKDWQVVLAQIEAERCACVAAGTASGAAGCDACSAAEVSP